MVIQCETTDAIDGKWDDNMGGSNICDGAGQTFGMGGQRGRLTSNGAINSVKW